MEGLAYVRDMTWPEVFANWRDMEAGMWDEVFRARGHASWEEYRGTKIAPFAPETRTWKLYKVTSPTTVIPRAWVGPFKGWKKYLPEGKDEGRFVDILASPIVRENPKWMAILDSFPSSTTLMGVRYGDEIALFEGSHRAMAITLAASEGRNIADELFIILAEVDDPAVWDMAHRQPNATK